MDNTIYIVGHQSPDTDSIVSAIVYAGLKNKNKEKAIPCRAGSLNKETKFVLDFLKAKDIKEIKNINGKKVILLDHGELKQAPKGIEKATIVEIIDHHKLDGISTNEPILYRAEPIGSTSTIIAKIFKEKGIKLDKKQAWLLLCGIISDTLKLTSPTTTSEDKKIAKELSAIAKINIKPLAEKMFEAKSDISGMSLSKIIEADYKKFTAGKTNFGFGVYETTNPNALNTKKEEIIKLLATKKDKEKLDLIFFAVVDIIKQKTLLYLASEEEKKIAEKAFKTKSKGNFMSLDKIVSRKKQMIPPLFKILS